MSTPVSGNHEALLSEWAVLLRACATTIGAVEMLYVAADLLVPDDGSHANQMYNAGVLDIVARILDYPTTDPATVERVLRNLPPQ